MDFNYRRTSSGWWTRSTSLTHRSNVRTKIADVRKEILDRLIRKEFKFSLNWKRQKVIDCSHYLKTVSVNWFGPFQRSQSDCYRICLNPEFGLHLRWHQRSQARCFLNTAPLQPRKELCTVLSSTSYQRSPSLYTVSGWPYQIPFYRSD